MEQCIFIVKSYCEMKSYNQVQTKFRTLFPELLPLNKTMIRKMLKRMRGMAHLQTWISGKIITTRTQENMEALPYASIGKKIKEE